MFDVNGVPVAVPPPSGYTVNFEHPQRQCVLESYIIAGIGMGVASFFMFQRFYVHYHLRNNLSFDDLLLLIAWAGSITIQALIIHAFKERIMGIHAWEIPYNSFKQFAIIGGYTTSVIYTIPTTLSKVVILLFYRKLESPHIWYRWAVNIVIFVVAASGFSILFSSLFPCQPVAKSWDIDLAEAPGYCIDRKSMYEATAALGVITDFLIILIPIPMVISLRLSLKKRLGLLVIFAVGSATVVTSIVRLALLISLLSDADQTWGGGPVCMWMYVSGLPFNLSQN
ncbi:hypothetical protein VHEMI09494 [[Torrubiella] hemipterigena]|uniref:Rhodopsin domain-containing protein n=1 Tax=[Torrubiella] hemipterigena TaxID=1531966 RepID=A0A0A1TQ46_9HYPO|nr:hypothetical protein VHEMI09494 [[Torrubiella] hemipterigena]